MLAPAIQLRVCPIAALREKSRREGDAWRIYRSRCSLRPLAAPSNKRRVSADPLRVRLRQRTLIGPQKKRDDAFVKVVGGNKHVAKRRVVDVRDVNFVLRACRRLHGNGD